MTAYIASPIHSRLQDAHDRAIEAKNILESRGIKVHCPWEYVVNNAWSLKNNEWGKSVFENDIRCINDSDIVVVISYGRHSTAGTNWEAGYAYGVGKTVIIVNGVEDDATEHSLMVVNGCTLHLKSVNELTGIDFDNIERVATFCNNQA